MFMVTLLSADTLGGWVVVGERRIRDRHRKSRMMVVVASLADFGIYGYAASR
jgi:hypothetical protein